MTRILPKLGLAKMTDAQLDEYAQDKIRHLGEIILAAMAMAYEDDEEMDFEDGTVMEFEGTATPSVFAALSPSVAQLELAYDAWNDALLAADDGTKSQTQTRNALRTDLEVILTDQAFDAVRISAGNLALYLSTGYDARHTRGALKGAPAQVTGVKLKYGDGPGQVKLGLDPVKDAFNLTVQASSNVVSPDASVIRQIIIGKPGRSFALLDGLPSGEFIYVRVRANGGNNGSGPWSDFAQIRVP